MRAAAGAPAASVRRQDDFGLFATALIGTSTKPRLSAVLAQNEMRSIEAGGATALPLTEPRARAAASCRASAPAMCDADGTESGMMSAVANGRLLAPAICGARLRDDEPSSM